MYPFLESYLLIGKERKINRKTFLFRCFFIILLGTACFYPDIINDHPWIFGGTLIAFIFLLVQIIKRVNDIGSGAWFISIAYQLIVILFGIYSFAIVNNSNYSDIIFVALVLPVSEVIFLFFVSIIPGKKAITQML